MIYQFGCCSSLLPVRWSSPSTHNTNVWIFFVTIHRDKSRRQIKMFLLFIISSYYTWTQWVPAFNNSFPRSTHRCFWFLIKDPAGTIPARRKKMMLSGKLKLIDTIVDVSFVFYLIALQQTASWPALSVRHHHWGKSWCGRNRGSRWLRRGCLAGNRPWHPEEMQLERKRDVLGRNKGLRVKQRRG